MAESAVVKVAREYREQLARNEDEALKRMAALWVDIEHEVETNFYALAYDVQAMVAAGQPVPLQYVYSLKRWRSMMSQIQRELPYYQLTVEDLIKDYQERNYNLGLDAANAIIQASNPSSSVWTRVYKDAAETMAGFAGNGAPLRTLLETDYGQLAADITNALVSGVALGKGVNGVVADMLDAMGDDYDRAMRIARTEINRAYRLANAEQYARSGVVEKVFRLCYPPTACFGCLMMDGEECPNGICDDHPNGKCTTIVQTVGGVRPTWETGREWFLKQDPGKQRSLMGIGRYNLWKNFGVPLSAMVHMKENPIWGGSPSMVTIADLAAQFGIDPVTIYVPSNNSVQVPAVPVASGTAPIGTPTTREAAITAIKNSGWYKSAIGISKAPDELTRMIDNMTEAQAKVFANGLKTIKKTDFNYSGTPHVSAWEKGVYVGMNKPAGKDKVVGNKTAIRTTFHELSHAIDLFNPDTVHTISGLRDKIEENALSWANKLLSDAGVPVLKSFSRISSEQRLTIVKELLSDSDQYHSVSDMFEAITNDRISGSYGHGKAYWKIDPNRLEKEFTAHSGQAWITGSRFTEVFGDAVKMVTDEMTRLYGQ